MSQLSFLNFQKSLKTQKPRENLFGIWAFEANGTKMGGKLRKSFFWEEVEVENAQKWIKVHNKTSEFEHFTTPERLLVSI